MTDRHQIAPYPVRLPAQLREQLEAAASAGSRSLHAEILARLQQPPSEADVGRHLLTVINRYEQQLAEAEIDKHIFFLLLVEAASNQQSLTETLRKRPDASPEALHALDKWLAETQSLIAQAQERISMTLDEAQSRLWSANAELESIDRERSRSAAKTALSSQLPGTMPNMGNPIFEPPPSDAPQTDAPTPQVKKKRMVLRRDLKE